MTIEEAVEKARSRIFHGASEYRYGERACGPECTGCTALRDAMLEAFEEGVGLCCSATVEYGCRDPKDEEAIRTRIQELGKESA